VPRGQRDGRILGFLDRHQPKLQLVLEHPSSATLASVLPVQGAVTSPFMETSVPPGQFTLTKKKLITGSFSSGVCDIRLCGLVVRVLGYRSGGPGSIPGTTKKKSCGSGMGSTQPREYN
jgi:hypothetical protein